MTRSLAAVRVVAGALLAWQVAKLGWSWWSGEPLRDLFFVTIVERGLAQLSPVAVLLLSRSPRLDRWGLAALWLLLASHAGVEYAWFANRYVPIPDYPRIPVLVMVSLPAIFVGVWVTFGGWALWGATRLIAWRRGA